MQPSFVSILEIWTGEIGFIANSIWKIKPTLIIEATKKDWLAFHNAKTKNNFLDNVLFFHTDSFPDNDTKYDLIISNPPQMPMMEKWKTHDDWWKDWLDIIEYIISEWIKRKVMWKSLTIIMNVFDFLWTVNSFWRKRSFAEVINRYWWKIVNTRRVERRIRTNGETFNNINYIQLIAPEYKFGNDSNWFFHYMDIVEIVFD